MTVIPRRWLHVDKVRFTPMQNGSGYLECEAILPPSSKGKAVTLYLSQADITDLIKELRHTAIGARL